MVTPLKDRDTLDLAGLERLVEHILAGGVHGLFLLGTTGEGPSLSYRVRCELIERVCGQVDGRVPVLVGVTDTSFVESVNLAGIAADEGAAAVVLAAPYYFPAGQPELMEYLEHIAVEMPLPVFLYNMPSHTKIKFELGTLRQALALPNVVGLKDSSGDLDYFQQAVEVIRGFPGASLLMGPGTAAGGRDRLGRPRRRLRRCEPVAAAVRRRVRSRRARRRRADGRVAAQGPASGRFAVHDRQAFLGVYQGRQVRVVVPGDLR